MCCIILSWFLTSAGYEVIAARTSLANMYLGMSDTCTEATGRIHPWGTFLEATHCDRSLLPKEGSATGVKGQNPKPPHDDSCTRNP